MKAIEDYQNTTAKWDKVAPFKMDKEHRFEPPMTTIWLGGGRKDKVRPGDILGALTSETGIPGSEIGKIDIFDNHAFVAVKREVADKAISCLRNGKVKGRNFNVRKSQQP